MARTATVTAEQATQTSSGVLRVVRNKAEELELAAQIRLEELKGQFKMLVTTQVSLADLFSLGRSALRQLIKLARMAVRKTTKTIASLIVGFAWLILNIFSLAISMVFELVRYDRDLLVNALNKTQTWLRSLVSREGKVTDADVTTAVTVEKSMPATV